MSYEKAVFPFCVCNITYCSTVGLHFTLLCNIDKTKTHALIKQLLTNLYASYKKTLPPQNKGQKRSCYCLSIMNIWERGEEREEEKSKRRRRGVFFLERSLISIIVKWTTLWWGFFFLPWNKDAKELGTTCILYLEAASSHTCLPICSPLSGS